MSNLLVQNIKHTNNTTSMSIDTSGQVTIRGEGSATTTNLQQGLSKLWLHLASGAASTLSISDSLNVSSIADTNTGRYTPTYTNNMNNATYEISLASQRGANYPDHPTIDNMSTSTMQMAQTNASAYVDSAIYTASVRGDLA